MYNRYYKPSGQTSDAWRDQLKTIKAAQEEFQKVLGYPDTPRYMIDSLSEDIQKHIQTVRPAVVQAALAEHAARIDGYKEAKEKAKRAVTNEINRWDQHQLLDAFNMTSARVQQILDVGDQPLTGQMIGPALNALYQEAKDSGDTVRLRATSEVFRSVIFKMPPTTSQEARSAANHLQFQAEEDLKQLKETEEVKAARQEEEKAWNELLVLQNELSDASAALDGYDVTNIFGSNEFTKAARRVRVIHGERLIFEPGDPEVTGVYTKE